MQFIDARDLAAFTLDRAQARDDDTYGVVRPEGEAATGSVLEAAIAVSGATTTPVWVDADLLLDQLGQDVWNALPMWHPQFHGSHRYDPSRAIAAGLKCRPLSETIADIHAWDLGRADEALAVGLSAERERELLQLWAGAQA